MRALCASQLANHKPRKTSLEGPAPPNLAAGAAGQRARAPARSLLAGDIELETFRERKRLIETEVAELETRTAHQAAKLRQARELVALALKLARNCHASYRKASPETKKLWNRAFFEDVLVKDRAIVNVRYAEPFGAIFAAEAGRVSDKGLLVEMTGFEPATSWLQTRRSSD